MSATFAWELLDQLLNDGAAALVCRHHVEISKHPDQVPLAIDWASYRRKEETGQFKVFTARFEGDLLGYIGWEIFVPTRYQGTTYCNADVYWLSPDRRGMGWGKAFFHAAKAALPRPCKVQWRRKIGVHDERIDAILRSLDLVPEDIVYSGFFPAE